MTRPPTGSAMASIPLKPGYGPTVGELLSPLWRRSPRLAGAALAAVLVVLVALAVGLWLHLRSSRFSHGGPVPFAFSYKHMSPVPPEGDEIVSLLRPRGSEIADSFSVSPLRLPAYKGLVAGELPMYASAYVAELRSRSEDFVLRGEGKTRINEAPGYNIFYIVTRHGQELFGRDVLLFPEHESHARRGVLISMLTPPGGASEPTTPLEVGGGGTLEEPLHSFSVG